MTGLVITKKNRFGAYEANRIVEAATAINIPTKLCYWEELSLSLGDNQVEFHLNHQPIKLADYNWCYTRSSSITPTIRLTHLKTIILNEMVNQGLNVLNGSSLINEVVLTKLIQQYQLVRAGLPVAQMHYWGCLDADAVSYPVIIKKITGSMGKGVFLAHTPNEAKQIETQIGKEKMLWQEYVPNKGDVRVLVLAGEALGAMKRVPAAGSHLSNVSAGGKAEPTELTTELTNLAVKTTQVFGLDFAGVDIMYSNDNKPYVLEVNRHPQFGGFEQATSINVAGKIVRYLCKQDGVAND